MKIHRVLKISDLFQHSCSKLHADCIERRLLKGVVRMCGRNTEEVIGCWRKLHNVELQRFYSSRNLIKVIKSRMDGWTYFTKATILEVPYVKVTIRTNMTQSLLLCTMEKRTESLQYDHWPVGKEICHSTSVSPKLAPTHPPV